MKLDLVLCLATAAYAAPIPRVGDAVIRRGDTLRDGLSALKRKLMGGGKDAAASTSVLTDVQVEKIYSSAENRAIYEGGFASAFLSAVGSGHPLSAAKQQKLAKETAVLYKKANELIVRKLSYEARQALQERSPAQFYHKIAEKLLREDGWSEDNLLPAIKALCKQAAILELNREPRTEAELIPILNRAEEHSIVIWKELTQYYRKEYLAKMIPESPELRVLPPAFFRELLLSPFSDQYLGQVNLNTRHGSYFKNSIGTYRGRFKVVASPSFKELETLKHQILNVLKNVKTVKEDYKNNALSQLGRSAQNHDSDVRILQNYLKFKRGAGQDDLAKLLLTVYAKQIKKHPKFLETLLDPSLDFVGRLNVPLDGRPQFATFTVFGRQKVVQVDGHSQFATFTKEKIKHKEVADDVIRYLDQNRQN
jgi:hypothetical protein